MKTTLIKEIFKNVPLMDSENIINIIEDYSEIDYYKNHNQPPRLELKYVFHGHFTGFVDEINIVYKNEYFYLVKESSEYSKIIYCKYDNEGQLKYYEHDYIKMRCDCPLHKGEQCHQYYKEHKLKPEKEGYFYIEKSEKRNMQNELNEADYILQQFKIYRQISMNEIELKIDLLEELYNMYEQSESEHNSDSDILEISKLVYYRDNIYNCNPFTGKVAFEFFKKVIEKETSFFDI